MLDWIPVAAWITRDPRVHFLGDRMGWDPHQAVGHLMDFWSWVSDEWSSQQMSGGTAAMLEVVTQTPPGFARALQEIGWLQIAEDPPALIVPDWDLWLSAPARKRFAARRRTARWRKKKEQEAKGIKVTPREKLNPELLMVTTTPKHKPPAWVVQAHRLVTEPTELAAQWGRWIEHLRGRKKPSQGALETQVDKVAKVLRCSGERAAIALLDEAISGNWQGLPPNVVDRYCARNGRHQGDDIELEII